MIKLAVNGEVFASLERRVNGDRILLHSLLESLRW